MKDIENDFLHAAELIAGADALVIAAGAGIGVDSGLPDFRGNEGFWQAYPALARVKLDFSEIASPRAFQEDPSLAWGFYGHRLALYRDTAPHSGFDILRQWGERMLLGAWVFTSNVDGQFQKAGFSEEQIHECHGSIHHLQCIYQCKSDFWSTDGFAPVVDTETCRLMSSPPQCPHCASLARPNVLMFSDWNWLPQRSESQARGETKWLDSVADSQARVVVVEIGAGTAIPSVRHFSHRMIHEFGARIIRINPSESKVPSSMDIGIATGSLEALRGIDAFLRQLLPVEAGHASISDQTPCLVPTDSPSDPNTSLL
jgi:NAD-dependent SIR2 family protein deacetylase